MEPKNRFSFTDIEPRKLVLILILLTFAAYLPVIWSGFIWDDNALIENESLYRSVHGLGQIWTHPHALVKEIHYWPMVYSSFWLEYQLWGLNPSDITW